MAIFIDSLGSALIIPLLGPLFLDPAGGILQAGTGLEQRNFLYGFSLASFSLCMFMGAPVLGALSDRLGRKPVLMLCLAGSLVGYVLSVIAIPMQSASLFLAGRILDGFTTGSMPIAQAAIFDVTPAEDKTKNVGRMMFAVSMGYILAPLIGGVLSNNRLISWFSLTTPFSAAALATLINLVFLQFALRETFVPTKQGQIEWFAGLRPLVSAFSGPAMRGLALPFLLMQFGWSTYFQFLGMFLMRKHGFASDQVGIFMALIGLGFSFTFGVLVAFLAKRFAVQKMALGALAVIAGTVIGMVLAPSGTYTWLFALPGALGLATGFSSFMTLFSLRADANSQGTVMGIAASISAFCAGMAGLLSGGMANLGASAPMWLALVCVVSSAATLAAGRPPSAAVLPQPESPPSA